MGFSGNKKNQLLNRVQRILNQPQNQSNVVEKMIATAVILCFMVVLSLGGNRLENRDEAYPSTDVPTEITSSDGIQNEKVGFRNYLKYSASDGELDSLPVKGDISDGSYNIKDSMHDLTIVVKDKAVVQFIMNGLDVPAAKIANFEKLIYKAFEKQKRYEQVSSYRFAFKVFNFSLIAFDSGMYSSYRRGCRQRRWPPPRSASRRWSR